MGANARLPERSNEEIAEAFLAAYAPTSLIEYLGVFQSVKCFPRVTPVDMDAILVYTRLFKGVIDRMAKGNFRVAKDEVTSIDLANLRNDVLSSYLLKTGLKSVEFGDWEAYIYAQVEEFRRVRIQNELIESWSAPKKVIKPTIVPKTVVPLQAAPPPVQTVVTPTEVTLAATDTRGKKKVWKNSVCLGCGNICDPPHWRSTCPYKNVRGWRSSGPPPEPPLMWL